MQMSLGKRSLVVGTAAVVAFVVYTGSAFAAPVLQPGVTSAPGMSGKCTSCHSYASSSSSASTSTAKKKTVSVSHPYTGKRTYKSGTAFLVFGYVTPRQPSSAQAKVALRFEKLNSRGRWSVVSTLTPTATVTSQGSFKNKTNYRTPVTVNGAGKYRVRAKLSWLDAKGVKHTKTSSYYRFAISK